MKINFFLFFMTILLHASHITICMLSDYVVSESFKGKICTCDSKFYNPKIIESLPSHAIAIQAEFVRHKQGHIVGLAYTSLWALSDDTFVLRQFGNCDDMQKYKDQENFYIELPNLDMRGQDPQYSQYFKIIKSVKVLQLDDIFDNSKTDATITKTKIMLPDDSNNSYLKLAKIIGVCSVFGVIVMLFYRFAR